MKHGIKNYSLWKSKKNQEEEMKTFRCFPSHAMLILALNLEFLMLKFKHLSNLEKVSNKKKQKITSVQSYQHDEASSGE